MSSIDPTIQITSGSDVRKAVAAKLRQSTDLRMPTADEAPKKSESSERPDMAREVLQRVAEIALENPPRDIQKLTASAAKFLLVNLEPALRLAEELREDAMSRSGSDMAELLAGDRHDRAIALLTDSR